MNRRTNRQTEWPVACLNMRYKSDTFLTDIVHLSSFLTATDYYDNHLTSAPATVNILILCCENYRRIKLHR